MWYLQWISGVDTDDSNESVHYQELPGMTSINQQIEARELALIAWADVCQQNDAIKCLYRWPHLVWKESLIPES